MGGKWDLIRTRKLSAQTQVIIVVLMMCSVATLWTYQNLRWHDRNNLPSEYQELFSTPFDQVQVTNYWNSSIQHGTRFEFEFHSNLPIAIKNESSYKKTTPAEDHRYPWAETLEYWERQSGDVAILLDRSRQTGYVRVHTPIKIAVSRNGKRLVEIVNLRWPNELTQMDKALNQDWAKQETAKGIHICNVGDRKTLIAVSYMLDPRDFAPGKFEDQVEQYLKNLDEYNPQSKDYHPHESLQRLAGLPFWSDEKLLELHIPDASLSEAQARFLEKTADQLSRTYANPQRVPIRLKLFVEVEDLHS